MNIRIGAFTETGYALANHICEVLQGDQADHTCGDTEPVVTSACDGSTASEDDSLSTRGSEAKNDIYVTRLGKDHPFREWVADSFTASDAIIFVGAVGIAVRGIAPHIVHKAQDPAVVCVDEGGSFVIPILSGHIGGANALALTVASLIDATPVITTATDVHGLFAVDAWAASREMLVRNPSRIKTVSSKLLEGHDIVCLSEFEINGDRPEHVKEHVPMQSDGVSDGIDHTGIVDFTVSVHETNPGALNLVPRNVVLGAGCRRDTPYEHLRESLEGFLTEHGLYREAIKCVCTIDLKKDEAGLIELCRWLEVPFICYSSEALQAVEGEFTSSRFVKSITGVDNVCERSAILGSGGTLIHRKWAHEGVTFAAAVIPQVYTW